MIMPSNAAGNGPDRDPAIDIARGLLIVLAAAPVAALALGGKGQALAAIGETVVAPGLMFLAGLLAGSRAGRTGARYFLWRIGAPLAVAAGLAALLALAGAGGLARWRETLVHAAPALQLVALPPLYALALSAMGARGSLLVLALALLLHVVGALGGPALRFLLPLFVYYAAGVWLAPHRARVARVIARAPFAAALAAPGAFAFALSFSLKTPENGFSLAQAGPQALAAGMGAALAAFALAQALAAAGGGSPSPIARIGRAARPIALFWPPLFLALAHHAPQGAQMRPAALALLAAATLAAIATLADLFLERRARPTPAVVARRG